ncbi:MAG: MbnP family protein [Ferruginibacter sp.]
MNKNIFYKRTFVTGCILLAGITSLFITASFSVIDKNSSAKTGTLKIIFRNTANGKPVILRDSLYNNYFGEQYSISKLKYYISNITMGNNGSSNDMGGYYLMNVATGDSSLELTLEPGNYNSLGFLLGVDSLRNCNGAQTGALDPMNDMFWTWNSGYVMFKMEGNSPASTSDLQRIEHHVGGYKGSNNVATKIHFNFTGTVPLEIIANSTTEILVETNLDNYWHGSTDIKISELPVCTIAGELAKKIALNFKNLFSIKNIRIIP